MRQAQAHIERGDAFAAFEVKVGDEAFLGAFKDVVGEALIEREVGGFDLFGLRAAAESPGR